MSVVLHWFLPTSGDSRTVVPFGPDGHQSAADARLPRRRSPGPPTTSASTGVLTPTGTWCEDAWLVTAALLARDQAPEVPRRLPARTRSRRRSPRRRRRRTSGISGGRLLLNIVTGGDDSEQRRFGDWLDHDERYDRTDEFLSVLRGALTGQPFDFEGRYFHVAGATVEPGARPDPAAVLRRRIAGAAELVAANHVDVYLAWGEPPAMVAPRLARDARARRRAGPRRCASASACTSSPATAAEDAWAETERFLDAARPGRRRRPRRQRCAKSAVGRPAADGRRCTAARATTSSIAPNLWAGIGLVRGGAGTALVGSHEEVADRIEEYHQLGFDEFILSGHPHLEEAYWFGEGVMPILRRRGLLPDVERRAENTGLVLGGSAVANAR